MGRTRRLATSLKRTIRRASRCRWQAATGGQMETIKGKDGFATARITSWDEFTAAIDELKPKDHVPWIYRGQAQDWPLATSLERGLNAWEIDPSRARNIEAQLIREFRRRYKGTDFDDVRKDTLYCLALMQHHGAPTRLLDCTYSPFVAAQNAIKDGAISNSGRHIVWCFFAGWIEPQVAERVGEDLLEERKYDVHRNDDSFDPLYQTSTPEKFVLHENPFQLNERLSIQQGLFLCPGSLEVSFLDNLREMKGHDSDKNIVKLCLELTKDTRVEFAKKLKLMNISSAALFPGLDGFSRSLGEHLAFFEVMSSLEGK
jgi:FRG domain